MSDVIASKVVARFLSAAMPPAVKRLVGTKGVEKPGQVEVSFDTEAAANKFEDKAKATLGLDDPDEAEDSKYEVSGRQDRKTDKYIITITY